MNNKTFLDDLMTLCTNESIGDMRKTEKLLLEYLLEHGVTMNAMTKAVPVMPELPNNEQLNEWPDFAKRRLGVVTTFVCGLPPFNLHSEAQRPLKDYMEELKALLDPAQAFKYTWYAGDRAAVPLMDEVAHEWGLNAGVHPGRLFQGLKTGVV